MLALVTLSAFLVALVGAESPTGGPVSERSYPPPVPEPSTEPFGCGMGQIACTGVQDECIPLMFMCDGTKDCSDESDEADCDVLPATSTSSSTSSSSVSPETSPPCKTSLPFSSSSTSPTAPGKCPDEDEMMCPMSTVQVCIKYTAICDGEYDCPDGEDESDDACEFIMNNGTDGGNNGTDGGNNGRHGGNNGRHGGNNGPDYGTGDPDWRQIGDMAIHAINVVEETLDHVLNVFRCIFHPAHCVENEMPGVEDEGSYSP